MTSIFVNHGLWAGQLENTNQYGYRNFENVDIKNHMRRFYPAPTTHDYETNPDCDLRAFINRLRGDQPGIVKTFINLWPVWRDAFPDARFFGVLRDLEPTIKSLLAKGHGDERRARRITRARHDRIERLAVEFGFPIVRTSRVMEGDLSTLREAFQHCGMEMAPEIVHDTIEPGKWRH